MEDKDAVFWAEVETDMQRMAVAIERNDIRVAREAWYSLGLTLAKNFYLVFPPMELITPQGPEPFLDQITTTIRKMHEQGITDGVTYTILRAAGRSLLRRVLANEPNTPQA